MSSFTRLDHNVSQFPVPVDTQPGGVGLLTGLYQSGNSDLANSLVTNQWAIQPIRTSCMWCEPKSAVCLAKVLW